MDAGSSALHAVAKTSTASRQSANLSFNVPYLRIEGVSGADAVMLVSANAVCPGQVPQTRLTLFQTGQTAWRPFFQQVDQLGQEHAERQETANSQYQEFRFQAIELCKCDFVFR